MRDLISSDDDAEVSSMGGVVGAPMGPAAKKSRGGRAAGSRNRRTLAAGKMLQALEVGDPLIRMARFAAADPVEWTVWLLREAARAKGLDPGRALDGLSVVDLACEIRETAEMMRVAQRDLLPYLHARITPDNKVDVTQLTQLNINLGGGDAAPAARAGGTLSLLDFASPATQ